MSGTLAAATRLLSVSHRWMHPTIEFNCRLSALFLIDPTGSAVLAAYLFSRINAVCSRGTYN